MTKDNPVAAGVATLWCVNIHGPDDVIALPDYLSAVRTAKAFNDWWLAYRTAKPLHERFDARMWAVPIEWPHDAASHASDLAAPSEEYAWLLSASPVQAGIDPLVAEIQRRLDAFHSPSFDRETVEKLMAGYRSQAERIAALESDAVKYNRLLEVRQDRYIAAESLLAEAIEALEGRPGEELSEEELSTIEACVRNDQHGRILGLELWELLRSYRASRATLSRLKPGEKGGE